MTNINVERKKEAEEYGWGEERLSGVCRVCLQSSQIPSSISCDEMEECKETKI